MGETSPGVSAFMEFPGIETNSIADPAVRRAFGVINEFFKRTGVFSDQDAKQSSIDTNATHRTGNGSDHADVASNSTHRTGSGSDHADVASNTTHRSSSGSDHAWLNQDLRNSVNVRFAGLKFGAAGQLVTDIDTDVALGTSDSKLATQNAIKSYVDTEVAAKMDDVVADLQALNATIPNSSASVNSGEFYRELGGDVKWKV